MSAEPALEVALAVWLVPRLAVSLANMGAGLGRRENLNQELKGSEKCTEKTVCSHLFFLKAL